MNNNKIMSAFEDWKKRSSGKYINAICKPCWELKYCPYGVLVENFEIVEISSPYYCRVFGHLCPVFRVAEPFTETKERRNISRNISSVTKRRIIRRDENICQICNTHIRDDEIQFDHIIPWSKGGSSDESNIRILCANCNRKRGNNFESEYLIATSKETAYDPLRISIGQVKDLLQLFLVALVIKNVNGILTKEAFCKVLNSDIEPDEETNEFMFLLISSLLNVFESKPFFLPIKKKEQILRYRWGMIDGKIHSFYDVCKKYHIDSSYCFEQENELLRQIGFVLDVHKLVVEDYLYMEIDNKVITERVKKELNAN